MLRRKEIYPYEYYMKENKELIKTKGNCSELELKIVDEFYKKVRDYVMKNWRGRIEGENWYIGATRQDSDIIESIRNISDIIHDVVIATNIEERTDTKIRYLRKICIELETLLNQLSNKKIREKVSDIEYIIQQNWYCWRFEGALFSSMEELWKIIHWINNEDIKYKKALKRFGTMQHAFDRFLEQINPKNATVELFLDMLEGKVDLSML